MGFFRKTRFIWQKPILSARADNVDFSQINCLYLRAQIIWAFPTSFSCSGTDKKTEGAQMFTFCEKHQSFLKTFWISKNILCDYKILKTRFHLGYYWRKYTGWNIDCTWQIAKQWLISDISTVIDVDWWLSWYLLYWPPELRTENSL